jgi:tetratricopeptide (TPR) repeat protein
MGVNRTRLVRRWLFVGTLALLLCGTADARPRKRVTKDKVIVTPPTLVERAQLMRTALLADTAGSWCDYVKRQLRAGALMQDDSLITRVAATNPMCAAQLRVEFLFLHYRFVEARAATQHLPTFPPTLDSRWLSYRWLFLTEDLPQIDSLTRTALSRDTNDVVTLLARGELLLRLLRNDEALALFQQAERHAPSSPWKAAAALGTSKTLYKLEWYPNSFAKLECYLDSTSLNSDMLTQMGLSLISMGRVNEAIELLTDAVQWNPWNELAHYFLGNGYARLNYTQLAKTCKTCFAEGEQRARLDEAKRAFRDGYADSAKALTAALMATAPKLMEPPAFLGSVLWMEQKFDSAEFYFRTALQIEPQYGRAHNGLAKTLEGLRMRENIHRAQDSLVFAQKTMPDVPRIGEFVVNWKSLEPRHQKQVALAVEPWKAYLPVLIECGSRYYIKPLHERLSEGPDLETIRDQRVEYDARLWDDVRGCGGFTTVTGIEDVERTIYANYNTVLHELTHQVHRILPPEDAQRITDVYRTARAREDSGQTVLMSRYQKSSVWEYFAEGANALYSPRRDAYDTREIVRERLFERDTTLAALVQYYMTAPHLEACYPVGLVGAAEDAVEKQKLDAALEFARRAERRAPRSESALRELANIYSLLDRDSAAMAYADTLTASYPSKTESYTQRAEAQFFNDGDDARRIETLRTGLARVDSTERPALRQALGNALWYDGRYGEAIAQYRQILRDVKNDPDALWGLGVALGDSGNMTLADSALQAALTQRSGVVDLRLDYARLLLMNNRLDDAAKQLEETQTLAHGDPQLVALKGWWTMLSGDYKEALRLLDRAVKEAPDQRLGYVLRLEVRKHYTPRRREAVKRDPVKKEAQTLLRMETTDVPTWTYLERKSGYVAARTWPKFQRDLLRTITDGL